MGYKYCECGALMKDNLGEELCLFCRSKNTHCIEGHYGSREIRRAGGVTYVPWCVYKERRANMPGGCRGCKNNERDGGYL